MTRPIVKKYFRSEVRGLDNIPAGPCLVVGNHSGGLLTPDMSVFAVAYYDKFGYDRPLFTLAHDMLFNTPAADLLRHTGVVRATRENAAAGLAAGAVVMVFPGGDHEVYRSTLRRNKIEFGGRTGYVTTAIEAGVPIVPAVSVGAQETQLYLTRGEWLSRLLGLAKLSRKVGRSDILPITFGFPFGLSILTVPVEHAAAEQDRHPGSAADRHRRQIRDEPRCARRRPLRSLGDAVRSRHARPPPSASRYSASSSGARRLGDLGDRRVQASR